MSNIGSKFRAFAELGRVSNLPTTFTNVMVGCVIGAMASEKFPPSNIAPAALLWLPIACFYIAGMAMNDLFDARIDATERPQRPIPSGRVSRIEAGVFIFALSAAGLLILATMGATALVAGLAIVVSVILYNATHAKTAASVVLLGMSRAGVYFIGPAALAPHASWPHIATLACALGAYTAIFSLIARREMADSIQWRRWIALALPPVAIAPMFWFSSVNWTLVIPAMIAAMLWIILGVRHVFMSPPRIKNAVLMWISGICLMDGLYLALLNQPALMAVAGVCFILTLLSQRRIAGT